MKWSSVSRERALQVSAEAKSGATVKQFVGGFLVAAKDQTGDVVRLARGADEAVDLLH